MSVNSKAHYDRLVSQAMENGRWDRVHLYQAQMRGQWVEDRVFSSNEISRLGLKPAGAGMDIVYGGRKYDIMSGTEFNFNTHAARMSTELFRMIYFTTPKRSGQ